MTKNSTSSPESLRIWCGLRGGTSIPSFFCNTIRSPSISIVAVPDSTKKNVGHDGDNDQPQLF